MREMNIATATRKTTIRCAQNDMFRSPLSVGKLTIPWVSERTDLAHGN